MEQRLLPVRASGYRIQVIEADQFALLQVVEDRRPVLRQFRQRQVDRLLAPLFEAQAGRLLQVAATDALPTPEVDQAFGPTGIGLAEALDIAECRGVGAGVVVGKGRVVTQADAEGKLNGFHAESLGSSEPLPVSP